MERIFNNLDAARAKYVEHEEKSIKYGGTTDETWVDVEADEVGVGKALVDDEGGNGNNLKWEQWCGILQRGKLKSLRLFRSTPALTRANSPGPGPIRKEEWMAIGKPLLQDRHVALHTDGARSHRLDIPGIVHCHVVHQKKKTVVNKKVPLQQLRSRFENLTLD